MSALLFPGSRQVITIVRATTLNTIAPVVSGNRDCRGVVREQRAIEDRIDESTYENEELRRSIHQ
jgi:hypothetical protein